MKAYIYIGGLVLLAIGVGIEFQSVARALIAVGFGLMLVSILGKE